MVQNKKGIAKERIFAFIDSQNLFLGIKSLGWELDYKKFYIYLQQKYSVDKVFMYIGFIEEYQSLYDFLTLAGFELIFKNTKRVGKGKNDIKGNIDVDLTVDVINRLVNYDRGIFVSADGDFCALYDYIIEKGKSITILIPNKKKYSIFLTKYSKSLRFMNDLDRKLGLDVKKPVIKIE